MAGRAVHDSAAAAADRERARQSDVSRRHRVRGRTGGGGARRIVRRARVLGTRAGWSLHICDEHPAHVAVATGLSAEMAAGFVVPREYHVGIFGSGLHHRAARFWNVVCGRRDFLAGDYAGDQIFRLAFGERGAVSLDDTHWSDVARSTL